MNTRLRENMRQCTPVNIRPDIDPISNLPHTSYNFHVTWRKHLGKQTKAIWFSYRPDMRNVFLHEIFMPA